ncbi:MAG: PP2C family protein-serine/threonine phosphatase, partial [Planctomycetaceae bacterium]
RYELGGDLCEVVPLSAERTLIAVGDASGDSVPAAMLMSALRGALRALCGRPQPDPARTDELMAELNRAVCAMTPAHQFMSLVFGVLDLRALRFTYTNAGHPAPLLTRPAGGVEPLVSHGLLLGVSPDAAYRSSTIELRPGDVLALFSDGVTEAMSRQKRMFRTDGVAEALRKHRTEPARDILHAIWTMLETHLAGTTHGDDRTLLVMKIQAARGEANSIIHVGSRGSLG